MEADFYRDRLDGLQERHVEWVLRNFGESEEQHPFFGVIEETGELFHALLKLAQGIRLNEAHEENIADAIGDILIYTMHLCETQGLKLSDVWPGLYDVAVFVGKRPLIRAVYYLGQIAGYYLAGGRDTARVDDRNELIHTLRGFLASLNAFAKENGIDLFEVLFTTWATVSKRDWTKNRMTGVVGEHEPEAS
jgi:NTP pyrophosphatase (non-canonical NTP hydrolase)